MLYYCSAFKQIQDYTFTPTDHQVTPEQAQLLFRALEYRSLLGADY